MAITVTEILGTDSISGSRIIINDNFSILRDEINAIESYLDPDAGTLDGLNSIQTSELHVGPVGNFLFEVTSSVFNINTDVEFTSQSAYVTVNGLFNQNSFGLLDENAFTGSATIDPTSGFRNYSIKHSSTSDFNIEILDAEPGQEITFFVEQKGAGAIYLLAAPSSDLVLDGTNDKISFDNIGSTVTIKMMLDSSGNKVYYVVGHSSITYTA